MDENGFGDAVHQRVHQLVRQRGPITDHLLEITFADSEVQVFVFTFG